MNKIKIYIHNNIKSNDPRITHAINEINNSTSYDKILIYFSHNSGGAIQDAVALIDAIEKSNPAVRIILIFQTYAVSAAAFIMCYFAFYNVVTTNVSVQLDGPVCVVFHKPRVVIQNFTHFASGLFHDCKYADPIELVKSTTPAFDEVFESMYFACYRKKIRIAPHMKSVYNMNGDVCVTFSGGPLNANQQK